MTSEQVSDQNAITNEDLDEFLAAGSKAMRGVELTPERSEGSIWSALPPNFRSQFAKGTVIPTDYSSVDETAGTGIALARLFLKVSGA